MRCVNTHKPARVGVARLASASIWQSAPRSRKGVRPTAHSHGCSHDHLSPNASIFRTAMKRSLRYLLLFIVGSVVCFLIFLQSRGASRFPRVPSLTGSDVAPDALRHPHKAPVTGADAATDASDDTRKPKVTIIAIWSIHQFQTPSYFPYFFQSVEANPDVDLLFVQVDRAAVGCQTYSTAPNVQELCLTEDQCK